MKAVISDYAEAAMCTWCEKETEAVIVAFDGGFLHQAPLCWKCLQKAVRVRHKQEAQNGNGQPLVTETTFQIEEV